LFGSPPERHCPTRNSSVFLLAPGQVGRQVLDDSPRWGNENFAASPRRFSERDGMKLQPFESR